MSRHQIEKYRGWNLGGNCFVRTTSIQIQNLLIAIIADKEANVNQNKNERSSVEHCKGNSYDKENH